ncbi:MAG: hypothetical protein ABIF87_04350 [Pseudomonadota bacterium]
MMKNIVLGKSTKFFLLGMLVVIAIVFLIGADNSTVLTNGRYQISSCGASFGENSGGLGAFVVDTVSGETKIVYIKTYGTTKDGRVVINNLNKNFGSFE